LIRVFRAKLEQLEASESLVAMSRIAMGSGLLEKDAARSLQAEWLRQAGRLEPAGAVRLATREEVSALGIAVTEIHR
jgi:hypothetical protein